mmetsp:Transcript_43272/g.68483  ORF Transcript_43272/g.68483 Transcript_43272/m.68483 type:complete len:93 (+) Transcript_43272:224-502(+)
MSKGDRAEKLIVLLINVEGKDSAKDRAEAFAEQNGIRTSTNLLHGFITDKVRNSTCAKEYGLKFVPHKVLIGKDKRVVANSRVDDADIVAAL